MVMFTFSVFDHKHKSELIVKVRFGPYTNWNMYNSMVMFIFSVFNRKLFLGKFDIETQNSQFKLEFDI